MKTIQNRQLDLLSGNFISEVQISYFPMVKPSRLPKVTSSADAYSLVIDTWKDIDYCESFAIMLLSQANKVLGVSVVGTGGQTSCTADARKIFQLALKANATGLILMHNHPSGNLHPSKSDIELTKNLKAAGDIIGIQVMDHLIVTSESYYSFADDGRM